MKKLLFLMLLCAFASAEFRLDKTDVSVRIDENGVATVQERIDLTVFGDYSMQLYNSGLDKNILSAWQEITGITEIKTHLSEKSVIIKKLVIRPQPLQKSKSLDDVWYGQIIVDYSAEPYYGANGKVVNNSGIVAMEKYKPRTTRYMLNGNSFSFPRTNTGDIMLDDKTTLAISIPENALITYVNPITRDLTGSNLPTRARALSWNGLTLVQFSLAYEVEQTLDKEVVQFFSDLQESIRLSITSPEGLAGLALAAILVLSYFYLRLSRR